MCEVLTAHDVAIAPSPYYEWFGKTPTRRQLRVGEVTELICAERGHPRTGRFASTL